MHIVILNRPSATVSAWYACSYIIIAITPMQSFQPPNLKKSFSTASDKNWGLERLAGYEATLSDVTTLTLSDTDKQ